MRFSLSSNAAATVAAFARNAAVTQAKVSGIVAHYGQLLVTKVKANASGRPGPRVQTGDYRRSINMVFKGGPNPEASVGTNRPQGRRLEFGFHGTDSLGRSYCVDEITEILTSDGWRGIESLKVGDTVLTLQADRWVSEWQPVLDLYIETGTFEMTQIEGRTLSALTTPDHRWLIERYYGRQRRWLINWRTTASMPANARIPLAAKCADLPTTPTHDDAVVELAAWFWTEGSYNWSRRRAMPGDREPTTRPISLNVAQSPIANPGHCDRIRKVLMTLFGEPGPFADGAHWHEHINRTSGSICFRIDRVGCWLLERLIDSPNKVPNAAFLRSLTAAQLELFIEVSILADGHARRDGHTRLSQANEDRIRAFEMACVLAGRPVVTRHRRYRGSEEWATTILRSSYSSAFGEALRQDRDTTTVEQVTHQGTIWCPVTANQTWLARRGGTIYFTGNSQGPLPHFRPALKAIERPFLDAIARIAEGEVHGP